MPGRVSWNIEDDLVGRLDRGGLGKKERKATGTENGKRLLRGQNRIEGHPGEEKLRFGPTLQIKGPKKWVGVKFVVKNRGGE